jgi:hypothetical protein
LFKQPGFSFGGQIAGTSFVIEMVREKPAGDFRRAFLERKNSDYFSCDAPEFVEPGLLFFCISIFFASVALGWDMLLPPSGCDIVLPVPVPDMPLPLLV